MELYSLQTRPSNITLVGTTVSPLIDINFEIHNYIYNYTGSCETIATNKYTNFSSTHYLTGTNYTKQYRFDRNIKEYICNVNLHFHSFGERHSKYIRQYDVIPTLCPNKTILSRNKFTVLPEITVPTG